METRNWDIHLSVLGWLYILGNAVFLAIGILGVIFLTGIGVVSEDPEALKVLSVIGSVGAIFFTVLAVPGLIAGVGLLKRRSWARILALVIAVLSLFNFPIGTAVSIYAIWVLLQTDVSEYFMPLKSA